jgi:hypothetical protein
MVHKKFEPDKYPEELYSSFEKFKELIKEKHNKHALPLKVIVELKSHSDFLKTVLDKIEATKHDFIEGCSSCNKTIIPIYYDSATNKFKTPKDINVAIKYIELKAEELKSIFDSILEAHKK